LLATLIGHLPYLMKHQYDEMNDMSVLDRDQNKTYRRLSTVNVRQLPGESGLGEEMDNLINKGKSEYRRKRNFKF